MSQGTERSATVDQVKSEVRQTIEELRALARAAIPFDQFCQTLLSKVVPLTGAYGAIIWQLNGQQGFVPIHGFGPRFQLFAAPNPEHQQLLAEVARKQQPLSVASESVSDDPATNNVLLIAVPILDRQNRIWGSLELIQRGEINEETQAGYVKFTSQLATLFARWQEQHDLRTASSTEDQWVERLTFIREIHKSVDLPETAFSIANETRRLLHADRVGLAIESSGKYTLQAVSSQDRFDNRANVVKQLNRLITASINSSTPLWLTGDTSSLPPKLAGFVNEYLDEAHSRTFAIIPLLATVAVKSNNELQRKKIQEPKKIGGLVIEFFDQEIPQAQIEADLKLINEEAGRALSNAMVTHEVFLLPLWRTLGKLRDNLWANYRNRTIAGLMALGMTIGLLGFYPASMKLKVDGVLQPQVRENLFAELDGVVKQVHFDHGETVKAGDLLITLRSEVLEQRRLEIIGQIDTLEKQIENLKNQLLTQQSITENDRIAMSGNFDQLTIQRDGLLEMRQLLEQQMEALLIYSPIDGVVMTWDAKRRLENLPILANQPLLSIANLAGPWQVELLIPQNKVGYIQVAQLEQDNPHLPADFLLTTNPNVRHQGTLAAISDRAEANEQGLTEFRAIVDIVSMDIEQPKAGAGVTARIDCGKQSLGFVWFYQVYDFLRTRVFF